MQEYRARKITRGLGISVFGRWRASKGKGFLTSHFIIMSGVPNLRSSIMS
jgi:hypothetical protein